MQNKAPSEHSDALLHNPSTFYKAFSCFFLSVIYLITIFLLKLLHLMGTFQNAFLYRRSISFLEKLDISMDIGHHVTFLKEFVNIFKHVVVKGTILSTSILFAMNRINIVKFHLCKIASTLHAV